MSKIELTGVVHIQTIANDNFASVLEGMKRCGLVKGSKGFQVGDVIDLQEVDGETGEHTGRSEAVRIIHISDVGHIAPGYVLLSTALDSEQVCQHKTVVIPTIWKHFGCGKVASIYEQAMNEAGVEWRSVDDSGEI